jgi:hypothetical protein
LVAGALAVLAIVEIAPNVPDLVSEYRDNHRSRSGLRADVLPDLDAATEPKQVVFFLSPDGVYNDYLVNYLAPSVNVTALNAGGDKNEELARASWPPAVSKMAGRTVRGDDVVRALQSGDVDVVIAPNFNLQWAAYAWPPPASTREAARERFAPLRADRRLATRSYPWFTTMRLRGLSGRPASP